MDNHWVLRRELVRIFKLESTNLFLYLLATSYDIPDQLNFKTNSTPHVYNITLKASDQYSTIYRSYQYVTQNMINFTIITVPTNTLNLIDDGSIKVNNILYISIRILFKRYKQKNCEFQFAYL
jgi:hypothetical protein